MRNMLKHYTFMQDIQHEQHTGTASIQPASKVIEQKNVREI